MNSVFITGTDTGVGKTVVTLMLKRYLIDSGFKAAAHKWVQAGDDDEVFDLVSYRLKFPASPHLSSEMERIRINKDRIIKDFYDLSSEVDFVAAEGSGGLLVPYDRSFTLCDIAGELELSVVVVVGNKLGAINHALLTIDAIRNRGMKIRGLILNDFCPDQKEEIMSDNVKIIKQLSGVTVMGRLPYEQDAELLYKKFTELDFSWIG